MEYVRWLAAAPYQAYLTADSIKPQIKPVIAWWFLFHSPPAAFILWFSASIIIKSAGTAALRVYYAPCEILMRPIADYIGPAN